MLLQIKLFSLASACKVAYGNLLVIIFTDATLLFFSRVYKTVFASAIADDDTSVSISSVSATLADTTHCCLPLELFSNNSFHTFFIISKLLSVLSLHSALTSSPLLLFTLQKNAPFPLALPLANSTSSKKPFT